MCLGCSFKRKKDTRILNAFRKILDKLNSKPNKILMDKVSEFYDRSIK